MKTLGRFVLIDNTNKKQLFLQWKNTHTALNHTQKQRLSTMSYSTRKNIISQLKPLDINQKKQPNIKPITKQARTSASTNQLTPFFYANPQRQNTANSKNETKTFYRTRSLGKFSRQSNTQSQKNKINTQRLRFVITQADKRKGRTISIVKMRREGLRYKISQNFFVIHKQTNHQQFVQQVKQKLFSQFVNIPDKKVYLFHLSKEPINDISNNINQKQYVIFADMFPKFDIPFQMQMRLFQQASILEQQIKMNFMQLEELKNQFTLHEQNEVESDQKQQIYQWQKIKNVKEYVDKLVQNPGQAKKLRMSTVQKDQIQFWCNQKYTQDKQKKGQKNPFFDVYSHFPKQTSQINVLGHATAKIDSLPTTLNKHQIKQKPIQNMMEKIKRQNEQANLIRKMEADRVRILGYRDQKQFFKELDNKNIPLAYQNIPYMMEKYGINRAEAYNLYNLYKSLEKVSAMRLYENNQYRRVKEKGIDRKTFDQGLKGLEINPGDQVIRNICYFPEFITWEQFIKIISISMRKTPKSKLEAILQGLGSNDCGFLTVQQIGIMVGSSLQKIFGRDQPQLKKYFVGVVMKQLDTDKNGTIEIEELKAHVLQKGIENLDLVSYLMLNS